MIIVTEKNTFPEISIHIDELKLFIKALSFIEIGIHVSQYKEYLNVDEKYVDKLIQDFSPLGPLDFKGQTCLEIVNVTDNNIHLKIGEKELRAIYGAITNISMWVSEGDISPIMGISRNEFKETKDEFYTLLRIINEYVKGNSRFLTHRIVESRDERAVPDTQIMDQIGEYIKTFKYPDILIKFGGFIYLCDKWENIVGRIPYNEGYLIYDYLHDIYIRETIQKIVDNYKIDDISLNRILQADEIFKNKTIEVNYIWDNVNNIVDLKKPSFKYNRLRRKK